MKRLIIVGAGGFGRETLSWARDFLGFKEYAFLDDNPEVARDLRLRAPVITTVRAYEPEPDDSFVCAVGNPVLRRSLSTLITERGGRFHSLIHPTASVSEGVVLDDGVLICPFALVSADAHIKEGAALYYHSSVAHDAVVGPWSQVSGHCDIMGMANLGSEVFLGSHAAILPGLKVGDRTIVGAGAVVTRNIPSATTVCGVPAKIVHKNVSLT